MSMGGFWNEADFVSCKRGYVDASALFSRMGDSFMDPIAVNYLDFEVLSRSYTLFNKLKIFCSGELVLKEIKKSKNFYQEGQGGIQKKLASKSFFVHNILKRGLEDFGSHIYHKHKVFLNSFPKLKLSSADKELVGLFFRGGNGSGILTADGPMQEVCRKGIKRFGLDDCIIYDAVNFSAEKINR